MPCTYVPVKTVEKIVERLRKLLDQGEVVAVIGASGSLAFKGWNEADREGVADLCAYRKLAASNSPELRRAIMRAEVTSGRKLNLQAVGAGVHSHDGGATWGSH